MSSSNSNKDLIGGLIASGLVILLVMSMVFFGNHLREALGHQPIKQIDIFCACTIPALLSLFGIFFCGLSLISSARERKQSNSLIASMGDYKLQYIAQWCAKLDQGPNGESVTSAIKSLCEDGLVTYQYDYAISRDRSYSLAAAQKLLDEVKFQQWRSELLPVAGTWDESRNRRALGLVEELLIRLMAHYKAEVEKFS